MFVLPIATNSAATAFNDVIRTTKYYFYDARGNKKLSGAVWICAGD